jgi:hypothetical protein
VASKLAAGRDKDYAFARALLREGLVDATTLLHRVGNLPIDDADRTHLTTWIDART